MQKRTNGIKETTLVYMKLIKYHQGSGRKHGSSIYKRINNENGGCSLSYAKNLFNHLTNTEMIVVLGVHDDTKLITLTN